MLVAVFSFQSDDSASAASPSSPSQPPQTSCTGARFVPHSGHLRSSTMVTIRPIESLTQNIRAQVPLEQGVGVAIQCTR
jgi:hypothetical protein